MQISRGIVYNQLNRHGNFFLRGVWPSITLMLGEAEARLIILNVLYLYKRKHRAEKDTINPAETEHRVVQQTLTLFRRCLMS